MLTLKKLINKAADLNTRCYKLFPNVINICLF